MTLVKLLRDVAISFQLPVNSGHFKFTIHPNRTVFTIVTTHIVFIDVENVSLAVGIIVITISLYFVAL